MGTTFIAAVFHWFCNPPRSPSSDGSNFALPGRRRFPTALYSWFNFPEPFCRLDCAWLSEQFYAHLTLLTEHKKYKRSAEHDIRGLKCIFIRVLAQGSRKDAQRLTLLNVSFQREGTGRIYCFLRIIAAWSHTSKYLVKKWKKKLQNMQLCLCIRKLRKEKLP